MQTDRAKHNILPPSKFGLVQITRERVRPATNVVTVEKCPTCSGTGEIQASILFMDQIEHAVRYILKDQNQSGVTLCVHPFIASFITNGLFSLHVTRMLRYKKMFKIRPANAYHFMEYRFFNKEEEEIKV